MQVTFYGAAREVTGSAHLLHTDSDCVLLDCGLFQGHRKEANIKNRSLPVDPRIFTNVVLSHAHVDHSGRLPLLAKNGFNGRIVSTRATASAAEFLLLDSAHIQESDANYLNYKTVRSFLAETGKSRKDMVITNSEKRKARKALRENGRLNVTKINKLIKEHRLEFVEPLYRTEDAVQAISLFDGQPYNLETTIGTDMSVTFLEAGHILGSAISLIKAKENGDDFTILYTGDLGRFESPILKDPETNIPEEAKSPDLLIIESTYGDRLHDPVAGLKGKLKEAIKTTYNRGGTIIIPSFAFGRSQELIYFLHELYIEGELPRMPVYLDSPLASKITTVFGQHMELYDKEAHETFLEKGINPFAFPEMHIVESVEESMALMREDKPHIVISASGMVEAGRILHHLRYKIHDPKHTILIVGYMAANTLGRRIQEEGLAYEASGRKGPAPEVNILGKRYPLKAQVIKQGGFSAHADRDEILSFLEKSGLKPKKIAVVHGEESSALALARTLEEKGFSVIVPRAGESIRLKK